MPKLPKGEYALDIGLNDIESLKGLPEGITELQAYATKLKNLEGLPQSVKYLSIWDIATLTSLRGITPNVVLMQNSLTEEEIENAKRGIFSNKVQENTNLAKLLKQYLLMH